MSLRPLLGPAASLTLLGCSQTATVATFNIRFFPEPTTDVEAVAEEIARTGAGVIAIQEIRSADAFERSSNSHRSGPTETTDSSAGRAAAMASSSPPQWSTTPIPGAWSLTEATRI